jgi:hypothetical protein
MKEKTAVEQFIEQLEQQGNSWENASIGRMNISIKIEDYLKLIEQAKEMEKYNAIVEAKKYYLKGFEDAELTQNQGCSHEQTMRDAETQFELVYPIKPE